MTADKDAVIGAIRDAQQALEALVSSAPESAWSARGYRDGWNAKQLLCHIASTSGVAGYLIAMANAPRPGGFAGDFDIDAFNAQQVAARQDKPVAELLEEVRDHCRQSVETVENTPDELLAQHFRAPWETEGPLADVIVSSIEEHLMMHTRDLVKAVS